MKAYVYLSMPEASARGQYCGLVLACSNEDLFMGIDGSLDPYSVAFREATQEDMVELRIAGPGHEVVSEFNLDHHPQFSKWRRFLSSSRTAPYVFPEEPEEE